MGETWSKINITKEENQMNNTHHGIASHKNKRRAHLWLAEVMLWVTRPFHDSPRPGRLRGLRANTQEQHHRQGMLVLRMMSSRGLSDGWQQGASESWITWEDAKLVKLEGNKDRTSFSRVLPDSMGVRKRILRAHHGAWISWICAHSLFNRQSAPLKLWVPSFYILVHRVK